jgi:hypothetical protein
MGRLANQPGWRAQNADLSADLSNGVAQRERNESRAWFKAISLTVRVNP